ncbi:hypothetical protein AX15_000716 [Amanita polypyramis BW_CC]|nr:hypothetical protein AX15_000716 [Amanita polypyramis BW_CC]
MSSTLYSFEKEELPESCMVPKPDLGWTRPPDSRWMKLLWRWRVWIEATFVLSMLEPWEKLLLITLFTSLNFFVIAGIVIYFPHHLLYLRERTVYYVCGGNSTLLPDC